jgi:DNA-binding response OmpR family regulator
MTIPQCGAPSSVWLSLWDCKWRTSVPLREFLRSERPAAPGCLVLDVRLPGISGLDFQRELAAANICIPVIFITAHGDIPMTMRAMKAGAVEFLTKPFRDQDRSAGCNPHRIGAGSRQTPKGRGNCHAAGAIRITLGTRAGGGRDGGLRQAQQADCG